MTFVPRFLAAVALAAAVATPALAQGYTYTNKAYYGSGYQPQRAADPDYREGYADGYGDGYSVGRYGLPANKTRRFFIAPGAVGELASDWRVTCNDIDNMLMYDAMLVSDRTSPRAIASWLRNNDNSCVATQHLTFTRCEVVDTAVGHSGQQLIQVTCKVGSLYKHQTVWVHANEFRSY